MLVSRRRGRSQTRPKNIRLNSIARKCRNNAAATKKRVATAATARMATKTPVIDQGERSTETGYHEDRAGGAAKKGFAIVAAATFATTDGSENRIPPKSKYTGVKNPFA
jgi:hypothetical protein